MSIKGITSITSITGKTPQGFTLIELLVSMIVVMLVGSIMLIIFFSALRGTNEAKTLIATRQTGNYALSQMGKIIRQAKTVNQMCFSSTEPVETLSVVSSLDNETTTFSCSDTNIASTSSAMKDYYLLDESANLQVSECSFRCGLKNHTTLPYVTVSFKLTPGSQTEISEENAFNFSSTILLRNSATY